uniref:Uncharacterized protein n=1 Tax=Oryza barthii TaxID=65489 RepID=A0A0D3HUF7_9ORYZ
MFQSRKNSSASSSAAAAADCGGRRGGEHRHPDPSPPRSKGKRLASSGRKDEEGTTSSDAVDLICDSGWQADEHHDDQDQPHRQSAPQIAKRQMAQSLGQIAKFKR